ncbi:hypothetical protein [Bifidobacterium crudilactis]|uniref:hypothetical protein n=1 Tax=Bifidobacterium crudilactis TaxID=327277 RepID=UPI0026486E01|nr:hypothetical protein [Bifidobacterium crudilactis]MDN6830960.1 hypothetical protein [Bifidobacterium crudilactis]
MSNGSPVSVNPSRMMGVQVATMNEFTLRTDQDSYRNDEISHALLESLVEELQRDDLDFLVLEPHEPIQGNAYIQVLGSFVMETRLLDEDGTFTQYSTIIDDGGEVLAMLLDYWEHGEPPLTDHWKDITKSLNKRDSMSLLDRLRHFLHSGKTPEQVPIDEAISRGMRR